MPPGRLRIAAAPLLALLLAAAQPTAPGRASAETGASGGFEAVVDARYTGPAGAPMARARRYRTLGEALASIPASATGRHRIYLRDGRYREKLTVDRADVSLVGESRDGTVLTYDAASDTRGPDGVPYGTRGSFTLRVIAPGFRAEHLTIENAFDYPANAAKAEGDSTRFRNPQGVALMLDGASDRAVIADVRMSGYQDTLFPNAGRAYFTRCIVAGHVDFIFGSGQAVFDRCDIVTRDRHNRPNNGYVVAPSTPLALPHGFLFIHSRLLRETPAVAARSVMLGRPWHPAADPQAVGSAVFVKCWMDAHIKPMPWDSMSGVNAAGTRIWFHAGDARLFEYRSTGPGASAGPGRRLLTDEQARYHTPAAVLRGWVPDAAPIR